LVTLVSQRGYPGAQANDVSLQERYDRHAPIWFIAEEVAKVNPDLVVRDKDEKPYSVRYDQVNAMLLNEFLKKHRKVQELGREWKFSRHSSKLRQRKFRR
jgi:hypothetical protein